MNPNQIRVVKTATDAELLSEPYYSRLWISVKNVQISRRNWLEEIADLFRDTDVQIQLPSGKCYEIPVVDDIFDDTDMRWFSYYLKDDGTGRNPKSRSRCLERLRLLDLYFRIKYPMIAEHFPR